MIKFFLAQHHRGSRIVVVVLINLFLLASCERFIDIPQPETQVSRVTVFESSSTANAAMLAIYTQMRDDNYLAAFSYNLGLSADELKNYYNFDDTYQNYYINNLQANSAFLNIFWNQAYKYIIQSNAIIEGVSGSTAIANDVKRQLLGEAKFVKGFCYFYLVNLFGRIPTMPSTDYEVNRIRNRSDVAAVYDTVVANLIEARNLLNPSFVGSDGVLKTAERLRPTQGAADAMLARVQLYKKSYHDAIEAASKLIGNTTSFSLLDALDQVFLKNSKEAIWQIEPSKSTYRPIEASYFIVTSDPPFRTALSEQLKSTFSTSDKRWQQWVKAFVGPNGAYYHPYKYRSQFSSTGPASEYIMILRLSEQFLIRAEAYAETGELEKAKEDLNVVRKRAGVQLFEGPLEKSILLDSILHEKRIEFFAEWGHRWFDLKRTDRIDAVMSIVTPQKGGVWKKDWSLFPIPQLELQSAPQLQPNNPGY